MKKLLVLMLVLGMASMANAYVVSVVTDGIGDMGHTGTIEDPLAESEVIAIKVVLNYNPYGSSPTYDGYLLSTMDFDLHVTGAGSLSATFAGKTLEVLSHNPSIVPWADAGAVVDNSIAYMAGSALPALQGPVDLVWDLFIHCDGPGPIVIDLTLNGVSEYALYNDGIGGPWPNYEMLTEGDLGDLVIYNVPEPMTIALLGLGGLFLRRRKK